MKAEKIDSTTYSIEDGFVRCFLIIGEQKALLVDSGVSGESALSIAKALTDKPVELICTHADRDHIAGNGEFCHFMMHPSEAANYYNMNNGTGTFIPVEDNQILDLGRRKIRLILIPGHTPGSIALLDTERRMLFPGDGVQDGDIYLFGPMREMHSYIQSLRKLESMEDLFNSVHPSHGSLNVDKSIIRTLASKAELCLENRLPKAPATIMRGKTVMRYDATVAGFLTEA